MLLQRFHSLARTSRVFGMQVRHGSGGVEWVGERWVRIVRSQSNIDTTEDPPVAELPESHDAGEGNSDFSNWVSKHEDTSWNQVLIGLGGLGVFLYGIVYVAFRDRRTKTPVFTLRELPTLENDIPTLDKRN